MLNKDLIKHLGTYNPDAEIKICDDYCEYDCIEISHITTKQNSDMDKKETKFIFLKGII